MKRRTKVLLVVSVLMLISSFLFAQGQSGSKSKANEDVSVGVKGEFTIADPPITLTAHMHYGDIFVLNDNWIITKEIGKMTGVNLKGVASSMITSSQEAFNLMIANHKIPDVVSGSNNDMLKYGEEGAFLPLNDLIDKYAPNYKAYLDKNPDVRSAISTVDGTMYFIPFVFEEAVSEAWFIRKDWLDKFDLPIPSTVEELHQALLTFRNKDANGNGQKDEIGFFTRGNYGLYINPLLNLYGVNNYWHIKDGKVAFGPYTPEYKDAIKHISQWYSEGLIDPELFTRGNKAREILYSENNGALIHDWIPSTTSYNLKMQETIPGFQLVGMLPPVDVNGERWEAASRDKIKGWGWGIGYDTKYPVEAIKFMDFYWTETGRRMQTYGIEGLTYTMVDGEPVYTDMIMKANSSLTDAMRALGGQVECMAYEHDASYERFAMDEIGAATTKMYNESGLLNALYPKVGALGFTSQELKTISEKFSTCNTYMNEMMQKWVFDGSRIDKEFDTYMANLKAMGMDEVVAAYQSAYTRAHGSK